MPRPDLKEIPPFYHRYINQAPGHDVKKLLHEQTVQLIRFLNKIPVAKRSYRYARGKWTIQEMLQHMIDTERVFAYRALCFARKDRTPLPPFDENEYAAHAKAGRRQWKDLMEELKAVRRSTELMYDSFGKEQLNTWGTANHNPVSVLALGFIIAGHANHHIQVLKERYLAS